MRHPRGKRWALTWRQHLVRLAGQRARGSMLLLAIYNATHSTVAPGARIPRSLRKFFGGRARV